VLHAYLSEFLYSTISTIHRSHFKYRSSTILDSCSVFSPQIWYVKFILNCWFLFPHCSTRISPIFSLFVPHTVNSK
jgi:hypothetical protein